MKQFKFAVEMYWWFTSYIDIRNDTERRRIWQQLKHLFNAAAQYLIEAQMDLCESTTLARRDLYLMSAQRGFASDRAVLSGSNWKHIPSWAVL